MEYQNDEDDLGKDHQDAICLSSKRHVEEDAEDIKWQERNDDLGDDARYDVLEFSEDIVHCAARFVGNTMPAIKENTSALITSTMAGIFSSKNGLSSSILSTVTCPVRATMSGKHSDPVP